MGGGNAASTNRSPAATGLSPRGRGKLHTIRHEPGPKRSIPAWAGETLESRIGGGVLKVYPRVGGGNHSVWITVGMVIGLSPRGRGKLCRASAMRPSYGSIPAWAGETAPFRVRRGASAVYPRVGGGNYGSTPAQLYLRGLSPRGRGKPNRNRVLLPLEGSIPAWAGETLAVGGHPGCCRVYPRVGGGNRLNWGIICRGAGLSPRGRGKLTPADNEAEIFGSIPAWAGETRPSDPPDAAGRVYPRVGGGNSQD